MALNTTSLKSIRQVVKRIPGEIRPAGFAPLTTETLFSVVQRLIDTLDPHKILLFGSYARGNPTPDSDLDLLIIMDTQADSVERVLAVSRLLRPRPFPVDILVRTPAEIENALASGNSFVSEILSRGVVLYER